MRSSRVFTAVAIGIALAACTNARTPTGTSGTRSSSSAPTERAAGTTSPAPNPTVSASTVATSLDPCQLVTAQEASRLAGTSFAPGKEDRNGDSKLCVYGAQTPNVFTVSVVVAASASQAQAAKDQLLAKARQTFQGQGVVTEIPDFADGGAELRASVVLAGTKLSGSALYALHGAVAFGFSDLVVGHEAPSNAALLAEANTVLGRLS